MLKRFWIVDAVIVVLAIVTVWRFVDSRRARAASDAAESQYDDVAPLVLGSHLALPGVDWAGAKRHLVLRLKTNCPACRASTDFYKSLSAKRQSVDVRLLVISSEDREVMTKWLREADIEPDAVVDLKEPAALGFFLVPTLLIVNHEGIVTDILAEKLDEKEVSMLWARLERSSDTPLDNSDMPRNIDAATIQALKEQNRPPTILDVRARKAVEESSGPAGAVRIPMDELGVRASFELPASGLIVVACLPPLNTGRCRLAGKQLKGLGFKEVAVYVAGK